MFSVTNARNCLISTSGLKSDVTIVFLDPNFLYDTEIPANFSRTFPVAILSTPLIPCRGEDPPQYSSDRGGNISPAVGAPRFISNRITAARRTSELLLSARRN